MSWALSLSRKTRVKTLAGCFPATYTGMGSVLEIE